MTTQQVVEHLRLEPASGQATGPFAVPDNTPVTIGRAQGCDICLSDPAVSRRHLSLVRREGRWIVTDLQSRHGTYVNGIRIESDQPVAVEAGDYLRLGPFSFRLSFGSRSTRSIATTQGGAGSDDVVERVPPRELDALAHRRLEVLLDGASAIHAAGTETELAESILDLVLAGTGFPRAAVLRQFGSEEQVEILASRDLDQEEARDFSFSRSLIGEAAAGHIARLTRAEMPNLGQSIERLQICGALCAPIVLDTAVIGYIYMDSREGEEAGYSDAGSFCHAVARLASLALSNLKRTELQHRQTRLEGDLEVARQAQAFLLPEDQGDAGPLHYAMRTSPGRVVAGDVFDIFPLTKDLVGICLGDVAGQGMGSAILMTAVLAHLRAAMARFADPGRATDEVNQYISRRSALNMFASLWVGVFDPASRCLHCVDAGHGHWMIRRAGQTPEPARIAGGLLVGIEPSFVYTPHTISFEPGDRLILYSDGVVEHRNREGTQFGSERLTTALSDASSPEEDVEATMTALHAYLGDLALEDDTTIASIEFRARD